MPEAIRFEKMKALATDLRGKLAEGAPADVLMRWIGDDPERRSFLAGTVFATIRWNRLRGRPKDAPLASAFVITHKAKWFFAVSGFFDEKWNDILDVSTFDLPDDGDDHRVGLMCMAVAKNFTQGYTGDNEVFVFAAKGVPWESVETSGPHGGTAHGLAGGFGNSFHADPSDGFRILPEFVFS